MTNPGWAAHGNFDNLNVGNNIGGGIIRQDGNGGGGVVSRRVEIEDVVDVGCSTVEQIFNNDDGNGEEQKPGNNSDDVDCREGEGSRSGLC